MTSALRLPSFLQIEPVGQCNLRCRMCPVQFRGDGPPYGPPAFMPFDSFVRILDGFAGLRELHLQGLGEPMMHPRFFEMVEDATARGITVGTNTNMTLVKTDARAERCVTSGLASMSISLDVGARGCRRCRRVPRAAGIGGSARRLPLVLALRGHVLSAAAPPPATRRRRPPRDRRSAPGFCPVFAEKLPGREAVDRSRRSRIKSLTLRGVEITLWRMLPGAAPPFPEYCVQEQRGARYADLAYRATLREAELEFAARSAFARLRDTELRAAGSLRCPRRSRSA